MEDRVKVQLDKEHSKRFKRMCHRNSIIGQEHKVLQSFYDNERKKRIHQLENETDNLRKMLFNLSQEQSINRLLKELSNLAFADRDTNDNVSAISSEIKETPEPEDARECRYLRIETNPFHPSEMSFDVQSCISNDSLSTLTEGTEEENVQNVQNADFVESIASNVPDVLDRSHNKKIVDMKGVVDKLVGRYDVDKLKYLTQVLMKTLHAKDRVHYEDQLRLIYNLTKYFSEDINGDKENLEVKKTPVPTNNSTFLFLKSDRQKAIKEEKANASKEKLPPIKKSSDGKINEMQLKPRRLSLPVANHLPVELDTAPFGLERRFSAPAAITETAAAPSETDVMRIYLKLGHGALLKLPTYNTEEVKRKQRSWTRKGLKESSARTIEDLRIVMRHCRYLRLPKDLLHPDF